MKGVEHVKLLDEEFPTVLQCASFEKEFLKTFNKSSERRLEYKKWLFNKLKILTTRSTEELQHTSTFEYLKSGKGFHLFSLRRPEYDGNPRILFSVMDEDPHRVYVMLLMFRELHDGDYHRMIPVAVKRMELVLKIVKGEG